jgi:hypothetical protein
MFMCTGAHVATGMISLHHRKRFAVVREHPLIKRTCLVSQSPLSTFANDLTKTTSNKSFAQWLIRANAHALICSTQLGLINTEKYAMQ